MFEISLFAHDAPVKGLPDYVEIARGFAATVQVMAQVLKAGSIGKEPPKTIVTLQVLRGIAAMLVVFAHAIDCQQLFVPGRAFLASFYHLENFRAVGVDIFFVISGFIMAMIAPDAGADRAASRFAIKRIVRIVPIYWLLTTVTTIVTPAQFITLPRLVCSFCFVPVYSHGAFLLPVILVGWTLCFEMYFYLLITAGLVLRKQGPVVPMVASLFAALALAGVMLKPHGTIAAFALNPIIGEFAIGCAIGHLYRKRQADLPFSMATGLLAGGVVCLLATVVLGFGSISEVDSTLIGNVGTRRLLIWGFPCGLVVAGVVASERRWRTLIPEPLRLVGDASYSIYLIQLLALKQFAMRWSEADFGHPDLSIMAGLCFAILAGIAFYGMVEKPLTRWIGGQLISPPRAATLRRHAAFATDPTRQLPSSIIAPAAPLSSLPAAQRYEFQ